VDRIGKVLRCDCGFEVRAGDEHELAASIQRHAWNAHGMRLSEEQALVMLLRSELDADVAHAVVDDGEADGRSVGSRPWPVNEERRER
jgi:hypothetical protein